MRLLWWVIYGVKVKFIIFIAILICSKINIVFHKKTKLLYVLMAIAAVTASIYVGISTCSNLDFSHPVLIFIGAIVISIIIDTCYFVMIPAKRTEGAGNVEV